MGLQTGCAFSQSMPTGMGRMGPGAEEHSSLLRPPAEEQPDGKTPCPRDSVVVLSHVKTWHLGSQHGKPSNRDS